MIEGWTTRGISTHLFFGGLYASALEHYHKLIVADEIDPEVALRTIIREVLLATWIDGAPWVSDHSAKTRANLIRTIIWYIEEFKSDSMPVIRLSDGRPAVEHSFKLPVDNGIILSGHLDSLREYSGGPYVMDQKTTSTTITPRYFDGFNPDTQMSLYTFAGRVIFNIPVKGVVIDGAQIAVGFSRFMRGFTSRNDDTLQEWYDSAMTTIEQTISFTREQFFPTRATSCGNYGGCAFREVCTKPKSIRAGFLESNFQRRQPWDPAQSR